MGRLIEVWRRLSMHPLLRPSTDRRVIRRWVHEGAHLCRFDLHVISSWYTPRRGIGSFLLTDPSLSNVSAPTPDLGPPTALYHIGRVTMYTYPYDLANKVMP